ncbi:hypothetical protein E2C01_049091 [Portunus trituberculatus]|uniref:Uncharacterized protein n=1 Tax=Portunus trituberculatus TaxID=210409 RepID=A0A5B7GBY3_PORTR|nr:hypothetical protein [Portunus trituberculatus]
MPPRGRVVASRPCGIRGTHSDSPGAATPITTPPRHGKGQRGKLPITGYSGSSYV